MAEGTVYCFDCKKFFLEYKTPNGFWHCDGCNSLNILVCDYSKEDGWFISEQDDLLLRFRDLKHFNSLFKLFNKMIIKEKIRFKNVER